ncbi:UNKNOWN [Stylonychia lemnae]|uniref:Uncharacterized protein n=1 Tax=Stylonychia lemnae TaxID=5949 RepID=A0A077ZT61_STYLE|nr:UNKNOWN [Stylonychia lemnae]|eukprot:CDW73072.1 UNKNOWN [Stylonychia lemnae]
MNIQELQNQQKLTHNQLKPEEQSKAKKLEKLRITSPSDVSLQQDKQFQALNRVSIAQIQISDQDDYSPKPLFATGSPNNDLQMRLKKNIDKFKIRKYLRNIQSLAIPNNKLEHQRNQSQMQKRKSECITNSRAINDLYLDADNSGENTNFSPFSGSPDRSISKKSKGKIFSFDFTPENQSIQEIQESKDYNEKSQQKLWIKEKIRNMTDKITTEKMNKNRLILNNNVKSTLDKIISQKNSLYDFQSQSRVADQQQLKFQQNSKRGLPPINKKNNFHLSKELKLKKSNSSMLPQQNNEANTRNEKLQITESKSVSKSREPCCKYLKEFKEGFVLMIIHNQGQ